MHDVLNNFLSKPPLFSAYTSPKLWSDPHISERMLASHIDPLTNRASRRSDTVAATVGWLDDRMAIGGKKICDLGCGPGLYTQQFHNRGAQVTGVDISPTSIDYARTQAKKFGSTIKYDICDYTIDTLPSDIDIFTLIFCDYCVLSTNQRSTLLKRLRSNLNEGGKIAFDVYSMEAFNNFCEEAFIERNMMNGFWAKDDYIGLRKSFRYARECASLERYLIIQPEGHWEIYNWLQYFSADSLERELSAAGFKIDHIASSLDGGKRDSTSPLIGVIASVD